MPASILRSLHLLAGACALAGFAAGSARAAEPAVDRDARVALGITVYNDGQALVRDTRRVTLAGGAQHLAFRDVAATIRPETAVLRTVQGEGVALLEQNFDFDLLTPDALLAKYVGRDVRVLHTNPATGAETAETARVLATTQGVVLRYADRIETGVAGRLAFADVPADLRERPTLSMELQAPHAGERQLELTYLAQQVTWKADYVATLDPDGAHMALNGWVTLTNRSGTRYENARLQLVAGTLNRVAAPPSRGLPVPAMRVAEAAALPAEERIADYHLYTMPRPTTIADNQTKELALLAVTQVPASREYVLQSPGYEFWYRGQRRDIQRGLKPSVLLHFSNGGGDLGLPLPAGVVRVYTPDRQGSAQLIGEDRIAHTAKGEKVELRLGEAFDLTADRTQTDFQVLGERAHQASHRIEIRNAQSNAVTVTVREDLHGDWRIVNETLAHEKESASSAVWRVPVPAEGKAVLEYTAVVTF